MSSGRRRAGITALLVLALAGGCSSQKRVSAENNRLRERVRDLERQVQTLEGTNRELQATARGASGGAGATVSEEILAATPRVVEIAIGDLSHARDTDDDGQPDQLEIYVFPTDGLGRFVQMVGDVTAHAAVLPAEGEAITIGRVRLGPAALRSSYRAGYLGSAHYTVAIPISREAPGDAVECVVQVEYVDGYTGDRRVAEHGISLESGDS